MAWRFNGKSGDPFGKYRIVRQLGAGGMGAVYQAVDMETGNSVALKLLPPESAEDPRRLERFKREAVHGGELHHENIVRQLDHGVQGGTHFLALEYVEGIDLETCVRSRGKLPAGEAYAVVLQVAKALDYAHQHGVVHRDVKPSNILLARRQGRLAVKLADLGLARIAGECESRVTSDGCTVGTIDFMAPEQARNSGSADTRSDIYSLGCTLFYMLAGKPPFSSGTVIERVVKHASVAPPELRALNPAVPAPLWDVCRRMLAKEPTDRYQDPAELLIALTSLSNLFSEADTCCGPAQPTAVGRVASPAVSRLPGRGAAAPARRPSAPAACPQSSLPISNSLDPTPSAAPAGAEAGRRRAAFELYEHARVALKAGNDDYALSLLLSCCRLAPGELNYRQGLRQAQRQRRGQGPWHNLVVRCYYRLRLEMARARKEPLQVLADGEELLSCCPQDLHVQLAMAQAAAAAGLKPLAVWLLEEARRQAGDLPAILRPLALLYEEQGKKGEAREIWEELLEAGSDTAEARSHLQALLVQQTSVGSDVPMASSSKRARRLIT
jgi:serine/threonine protein kinase